MKIKGEINTIKSLYNKNPRRNSTKTDARENIKENTVYHQAHFFLFRRKKPGKNNKKKKERKATTISSVVMR